MSQEEVVKPDVLGKVDDPDVFQALKSFRNPSEKRMQIEKVLMCACLWAYRAQKEGPLGADEIVSHLVLHHNIREGTAKGSYLPKVLERLARKGVPMDKDLSKAG